MNFNKPFYLLSIFVLSNCCAFQSAFSAENLNEQADIKPSIKVDSIANNSVSKAKAELIKKLGKIKFFTATFEQNIIDHEGNVLQKGGGALSVKKPNLVNWDTQTPDESLIVSDGEVLWFFDPFIDQVSAYTLQGAISNTPILLLTSDSQQLWDHYNVSQINKSTYLIHAIDENSRVKSLELNFDTNTTGDSHSQNCENKLSGFTFLDATGQLSVISLKNVNCIISPEDKLFKFVVPEGVHLDDQR